MKNTLTILLVILILSSCGKEYDVCNDGQIEWMEISETIDETKQKELIISLASAVKADIKNIKETYEGDADLDFDFETKKILNRNTKRKMKVSQSFYQRANAAMRVMCEVSGLMEDNKKWKRLTRSQKDALVNQYIRAQNQLLNLSEVE